MKHDNDYPTTKERMETRPEKEIFPLWFLTFLAISLMYLVWSFFWFGHTEGELALEKAKTRTYQSFQDYEIFREDNK